MSDKLMTLIDRYADLVYKSRTEPVSKYELREYDAIRCRMDIEEALSDARAQAFEECAKISEDHAFWAGEESSIEPRQDRKMASSAQKFALTKLAQAIRQHSQKGRGTE